MRFSKPVAFNDKTDAELLKFIGRKNFSGYVKKLILADMQKKSGPEKPQEALQDVLESQAPESKQERLERIRRQAGASNKPFTPSIQRMPR